MATYANETYVGTNDLKQMVEEPPLAARMENILSVLVRALRQLEELSTGPQPEKLDQSSRPAIPGVLQLGVECEKVANAVENQTLILTKRIGRL